MFSNSMSLFSIDPSFARIIFCRCHCSDTTATRRVAAASRTPNIPTSTSGFIVGFDGLSVALVVAFEVGAEAKVFVMMALVLQIVGR